MQKQSKGPRSVKMGIDFVHTQVEVLQIQWHQTRQRVLLPVESIKERLMLKRVCYGAEFK